MPWIVTLPGTTKAMDPGPWIVVLSGTTNAMDCGIAWY